MASSSTTLNRQNELMRVVAQALPKFKKLPAAKQTELTIRRRINDLQQLLPQLRDHHVELQATATAELRKDAYFIESRFERCMDMFGETIDFLEDALVSLSMPVVSAVQAAPSVHAAQTFAMPLPKFKLPTFDGKMSEWEEFQDRFSAMIIKDTRLADADKMKYLCTALAGSARRAIAHLRITDTNFQIAWDLVCLKFQNTRENIAFRFATFHAVPCASAHSLQQLQSLQEVVKSTPRSIQGLGRTVDGWNDLYVDCVLRKLDREARMMLADRLPNDTDAITLEQVEEFIEHRIRVLQSGGNASASSSSYRRSNIPVNESHSKFSHNTVASNLKCKMCSSPHKLNICNKFRILSTDQRRQFVKDNQYCWLCLSTGHSVRVCTSTYRCNLCNNKHHILLHQSNISSPSGTGNAPTTGASATFKVTSPATEKSGTSNAMISNVVSNTTTVGVVSGVSVLLATAIIKLFNSDGRNMTVRALLDQGSQVTLISENAAQHLRVRRIHRPTKICGVGGKLCISRHMAQIGIGYRLSDSADHYTDALIVSQLIQVRAARAANASDWIHLDGLPLADPDMSSSAPIDIIIGAELYGSLLQHGIRKGRPNTPIVQKTSLGWIVSGRYSSTTENDTVSVNTTVLEKLGDALQRFWQVEEIPSDTLLTPAKQE